MTPIKELKETRNRLSDAGSEVLILEWDCNYLASITAPGTARAQLIQDARADVRRAHLALCNAIARLELAMEVREEEGPQALHDTKRADS